MKNAIIASVDIEDMEGFHGKPLGGKAESVIAHIEAKMVNKNGHGLCPSCPTNNLQAIDISNMKLSDPPAYKKGDKVGLLPSQRFHY